MIPDPLLGALNPSQYREWFNENHKGHLEASSDRICLALMHKTRLTKASFPAEEKKISRQWLAVHSFCEDLERWP